MTCVAMHIISKSPCLEIPRSPIVSNYTQHWVKKMWRSAHERFVATYLEAKPQAAPWLKFSLMKFISKNNLPWPMVHGIIMTQVTVQVFRSGQFIKLYVTKVVDNNSSPCKALVSLQ